MGHAIDEDRLQARIGDDDLIQGGGGGVAVKEGLQIRLEQGANLRQLLQELHRQLLGLGIQLLSAQGIHRLAKAQGDGDLLAQVVGHILRQGGEAVLHGIHPVAGIAEIPGEEQPLQLGDQADDDLPVRLGEGLDAVDGAALGIIRQQRIGEG